MKSIIILFALIVAASCDVSFIGQGWSKTDTGYNYPKAKAYDNFEEELVQEVEYEPEVVDIFEIQPKAADEVVVEEVSNQYLPPVPVSNEYLPPTEYRKRRRSQIKRQTPVKRIYRRANKKL